MIKNTAMHKLLWNVILKKRIEVIANHIYSKKSRCLKRRNLALKPNNVALDNGRDTLDNEKENKLVISSLRESEQQIMHKCHTINKRDESNKRQPEPSLSTVAAVDKIKKETITLSTLSLSLEDSEAMKDIVANKSDSLNKSALTSMKSILDDSLALPQTYTLLRTENGGRVYIVGVCHETRESEEDVASVIQTVQPDIVVFEFCVDRKDIPCQGESISLNLFNSYSLLFKEANSISGCLVQLGDELMSVTAEKLVRSLSTWQMLKFGFEILRLKFSRTKADVENSIERSLIDLPVFHKVVVQDRDLYLANSLKLATNITFVRGYLQTREKKNSIHEPPIVVGVVGKSHVEGIVQNWKTVQPEDVEKLLIKASISKAEKYVGFLLRISFAFSLVIGIGYVT